MQSHGAPRIFSLSPAGEEQIFLGPWGPRAGELTGTNSTCPCSMTPKLSPLALTLLNFEGCRYDTMGYWYLWQFEGTKKPDPYTRADLSRLGLCMRSSQGSTEQTPNLTWCYRWRSQTKRALLFWNSRRNSSVWGAGPERSPANTAEHYALLLLRWRHDQSFYWTSGHESCTSTDQKCC